MLPSGTSRACVVAAPEAEDGGNEVGPVVLSEQKGCRAFRRFNGKYGLKKVCSKSQGTFVKSHQRPNRFVEPRQKTAKGADPPWPARDPKRPLSVWGVALLKRKRRLQPQARDRRVVLLVAPLSLTRDDQKYHFLSGLAKKCPKIVSSTTKLILQVHELRE